MAIYQTAISNPYFAVERSPLNGQTKGLAGPSGKRDHQCCGVGMLYVFLPLTPFIWLRAPPCTNFDAVSIFNLTSATQCNSPAGFPSSTAHPFEPPTNPQISVFFHILEPRCSRYRDHASAGPDFKLTFPARCLLYLRRPTVDSHEQPIGTATDVATPSITMQYLESKLLEA
jgi:hypothetical protein